VLLKRLGTIGGGSKTETPLGISVGWDPIEKRRCLLQNVPVLLVVDMLRLDPNRASLAGRPNRALPFPSSTIVLCC
jgi:hypothetical protein